VTLDPVVDSRGRTKPPKVRTGDDDLGPPRPQVLAPAHKTLGLMCPYEIESTGGIEPVPCANELVQLRMVWPVPELIGAAANSNELDDLLLAFWQPRTSIDHPSYLQE